MFYNQAFLKDKSYNFIDERFQTKQGHLSFLNEKFSDIEIWKEEARRYIWDKLSYSPIPSDFNEQIVEEADFGSYKRQKIYFNSTTGCRIPAYILIPYNISKPAPGVIVLHDHGAQFYWGKEKSVGHKKYHPMLKKHIELYYSGKPTASALAERGYVTIVTDSLFFGERKYDITKNDIYKARLERFSYESEKYIKEFNKIEFEVEPELVRAIYQAGYTFMGIRTWDDMSAVSYLCSRPEVDTSRIGCIGLSVGGHRAGWLSAMDERIMCAVVIGWMARSKEMVEQRITNIPWMCMVPGLYDAMDYPDVYSLSVPRPLLVMHGAKDTLFPDKTGEKAAEIISNVYKKAGFEENFSFDLYDVPHEFNAQMQERAYSWMDRHLVKEK